ncbi:hypothetical protein AKJ38_00670 [candidate division MSBL1 archaeon SCGC-AAA259I14]|uniref:DUF998 domain-containing protein n=1 Tax=candidate division MSBL1 archaeon SCGC-AAA259I14 TaxID=1698268 RepID=A0A133UTW5_9EURY|nr:hypothetical protein AKJ38_00670 [candidate division MSBL1 archaeon SCGC-AAA259I14]
MQKKINLLSLMGIITPIAGFFTIFISIYLHDWFSWSGNALSDLGALGVQYANVYNYGLIFTSILGLIFVISLFSFLRHIVSRFGVLIFAVGLIFLIAVAVFPSGTSPHVMVSLSFFGFCALGILLVGVGESLEKSRLGYLSLALVTVGTPLAYLSAVRFTGAAIPEMVGVICFSVFSISYALKIYGSK